MADAEAAPGAGGLARVGRRFRLDDRAGELGSTSLWDHVEDLPWPACELCSAAQALAWRLPRRQEAISRGRLRPRHAGPFPYPAPHRGCRAR